MKKTVFNPYLPEWEYVPDGEPHLFNGRVYIYGSHDVPNGKRYCEGDYVTWSAPEDDLSDWRFEGEIYKKTQDPSNAEGKMQLWAPDVTCGPDGRYYLYYCFSFYPEIGVAVSDSPSGPFEFYGHIQYKNGDVLKEHMPFDPAVLTDDDGRVYLYYGFAPAEEKEMSLPEIKNIEDLPEEFREMAEVLKNTKFGEYCMVVELEPDMLTVKVNPTPCIPGGKHTKGTGFEGHGFFEAASIRKIKNQYYLLYSSHKSHELCYSVSDNPTSGFKYGGTVISNGDIGLNGRKNPVSILSNNHGGLVEANGQWYIFYHKATNGTEYSRQGSAEKVVIDENGKIEQVEITSCGLNDGAMKANGEFSSAIACHLTCDKTMDFIDFNNPMVQEQSLVAADIQTKEQYIKNVKSKTKVGYKYFEFNNNKSLSLTLRGDFNGKITIGTDEQMANVVGAKSFSVKENNIINVEIETSFSNNISGLYFEFEGEGHCDFLKFKFN